MQPVTIAIIAITVLTSYRAFKDQTLFGKMVFHPYTIFRKKEYYRLITHGFIHGDTNHLLFNMFSFFLFGASIESYFKSFFGSAGMWYYILLYLGGIVIASLKSLIEHKNNPSYSAIGASGAVSAIVFAFILINPLNKIGFFIIPPFLPAWIFGLLYLAYSHYMAKKQMDNIGHDAHFWGAVFGLGFTLLLKPSLFTNFINQIVG